MWEIRDAGDLASVRTSMCSRVRAVTDEMPEALGVGAWPGTPGSASPAAPAPAPLLASPAERAGLVFTELATNALRHASGPVTATLARTHSGWLVTVTDGHPDATPLVVPAQRHRVGGHGLRLVVRLSSDTGWYHDDDLKHVWADVPDAPPSPLMVALTG